ncbi:hypothetical protein L1987_03487 [Smallanthus sonchifolius]|uniref:Uncharacterized protein n=1 Tax=Smallanthus sonchifolius TaxID=185202 RepID=A0ACB9KAQ3_9ASTR|nr:hypothetical protein L1987_03487 [Smallanthus sonchifolius]
MTYLRLSSSSPPPSFQPTFSVLPPTSPPPSTAAAPPQRSVESKKESLTLMESSDCGYLYSYGKEISVCNEISNMKSDSFQVDMEPFSHLTNKDHIFSSRSNLARSLSKKGEEKKKMSDPSVDNERDAIFSLKATGLMSETSIPVSLGIIEPQSHHQISIVTAATTTTATGTPMKSKLICKRSTSFKQTSIINPTRIVFFFATLSSMGTILLIYFTLSMAKYSGDKKFRN